ncbi:5'-methylthioadenosine/adenosylhomocysteine nucleosidase [Rhodoferax saidenbachensis]|uniref:adenosylhomocysteine nucleosidase n=1 Tax=Rhodoferax saidenbachensis TaxID=1484693 RepID=A0A1P8KEK2_9BURK|nr:5'-methylthioadenosine/adenosylhomocysteine nucleosidase [Rhodoferax saidenbachensis]APW44378.1 5'-methylthioadenosine/S-adenosylhomocysteine nucleosidase [Rhodoferax saidenbachensis]
MTDRTPTAILSALAEEQQGLIAQLQSSRRVHHAGRDFWCGELHGQPVVLGLSRIGKVAAATTTAALIEKFGVARVVFTGVAGGVGADVQVGDVVVGSGFVQHDMDASPLFPRYEIPLTGQAVYAGDAALTARLLQASQAALRSAPVAGYRAQVHQGLIASGDRFVNGAAESAALVLALQNAGHQPLAVEMEGAAVAQVCADYGIPFAAVRTISDRADDSAHVDFPQFVSAIASVYARSIVMELLLLL